jgi:hypothetical protein
MPLYDNYSAWTKLADGRIFTVDWGLHGEGSRGVTAAITDPAKNTWSYVESLPQRTHLTVTMLKDGRVLIAGGFDPSIGQPFSQHVTRAALLLDPAKGSLSPTGDMTRPRAQHVAATLRDGRVLIAGGRSEQTGEPDNSAELYNPSSGTFEPTGGMATGRVNALALTLSDGDVLVVGGFGSGGKLASAELFEPAIGKFAAAVPMMQPLWPTVTKELEKGLLLVLGL